LTKKGDMLPCGNGFKSLIPNGVYSCKRRVPAFLIYGTMILIDRF